MKYQGLRRWAAIVAVAVAAASVSRGIVLTFFYDIFDSCLTALPGAEPSFVCEYGPQLLLNGLSGLLFMAFGFVVLVSNLKLVSRLAVPVMGLALIVLMTGSWRFLNSLSESFFISQGPATFTEYLFVLYANLEALTLGTIIALFYNAGMAMNKGAITRASRKEPQAIWGAKKA